MRGREHAATAKTSERRLTIFLKGCGNSQIRNTRMSAVCLTTVAII